MKTIWNLFDFLIDFVWSTFQDLINSIEDEKHMDQLKKALDCMLLILKCVNDRMHSISITGFKVSILQS